MDDYNYSVFDASKEASPFSSFPDTLHAGQRAPDFEVDDLGHGTPVPLSELWSEGYLIVEFGSFT